MRKSIVTALCTAAFILAGCQSTVNSLENDTRTMTPNVINDRRFITDTALRDNLALTNLYTTETTEGFLKVQLAVQNRKTGTWQKIMNSNPYCIRYKFAWFDANGMEIKSILSDWQDIKILPGETRQIQSVAPTQDCKDFSISFIEAK